ncbi:hypothetical protein KKA03_06925 [archaeon]|nr:hypothetical protein [archaeon]
MKKAILIKRILILCVLVYATLVFSLNLSIATVEYLGHEAFDHKEYSGSGPVVMELHSLVWPYAKMYILILGILYYIVFKALKRITFPALTIFNIS